MIKYAIVIEKLLTVDLELMPQTYQAGSTWVLQKRKFCRIWPEAIQFHLQGLKEEGMPLLLNPRLKTLFL